MQTEKQTYDCLFVVFIDRTDDGTEWTADVSKLIQDYNFNNGLRISFTKTKNEDGYEVSADLVKGSITEEYLEENYLANLILERSSREIFSLLSKRRLVKKTSLNVLLT